MTVPTDLPTIYITPAPPIAPELRRIRVAVHGTGPASDYFRVTGPFSIHGRPIRLVLDPQVKISARLLCAIYGRVREASRVEVSGGTRRQIGQVKTFLRGLGLTAHRLPSTYWTANERP